MENRNKQRNLYGILVTQIEYKIKLGVKNVRLFRPDLVFICAVFIFSTDGQGLIEFSISNWNLTRTAQCHKVVFFQL